MSGFAQGVKLSTVITHGPVDDTFQSILERTAGLAYCVEAHIQADNETKIFNVFQFTGNVRILNQWAEITEITALTNCTGVHADIWDGSVSDLLTDDSPGATLSGLALQSLFLKDKTRDQPYTVVDADQVRCIETVAGKRAGRPFSITAKYGATNYIRFHVTTNTTLDFKMLVFFEYEILNGGSLVLV